MYHFLFLSGQKKPRQPNVNTLKYFRLNIKNFIYGALFGLKNIACFFCAEYLDLWLFCVSWQVVWPYLLLLLQQQLRNDKKRKEGALLSRVLHAARRRGGKIYEG